MRLRTLLWTLAFCLVSLSLSARQIMIIGAHPDDEALMAAGIIQRALEEGVPLKVVIVTNGDSRGVEIGAVRQRETVDSLALLGVDENDIVFLGYPNNMNAGLLRIYNNHPHEHSAPYTSPLTGRSTTYASRGLGRSDFHSYIYGRPAPYTRHHLVLDLRNLFNRYRPASIYTHSDADEHPDHRVTFYAVKDAIGILTAETAHFRPRLFGTVVHPPTTAPYNDFWPENEFRAIPTPNFSNDLSWPEPAASGPSSDINELIKRFTPTVKLTEPPNLLWTSLNWNYHISLLVPPAMQNTDLEQNPKFQMLKLHETQHHGSGIIFAFGKQDELCWPIDIGPLQPRPVNLQPYFTYGPIADAPRLEPGVQTRLRVRAEDPESQPITYTWSAQYGQISGNSETVFYNAPAQTGLVDIVTVAISDGVNQPLTADLYLYITDDPDPAAVELWVSMQSNRADPALLDGLHLAGNVYIFTAPDDNVSDVLFYLNDLDHEGAPFQIERIVPYDFAGTGLDLEALPFNVDTLPDGEHIVSAVVTFQDGSKRNLAATFTVSQTTFQLEPDIAHTGSNDEWLLAITVDQDPEQVVLIGMQESVAESDELTEDEAAARRLVLHDGDTMRWLLNDIREVNAVRSDWLLLVSQALDWQSVLTWEFAGNDPAGTLEIAVCNEAGTMSPETLRNPHDQSLLELPAYSQDTFVRVSYTSSAATTERQMLQPGWNFISVTVQARSEDIAALLTDETLSVQTYSRNTEEWYHPETIEPLTAYWIWTAAAVEISVTGQPAVAAAVTLQPGWNLLGPLNHMAIPTEAISVYTWDAAKQVLRKVNTRLRSGAGYWIFLDAELTFIAK